MKKRSSYRPRSIIRDPIGYVIKGMSPMTPQQILNCSLQHHDALYRMTHGEASMADWQLVCHMINTSVALSQTLFDGAYLDDLKAAMVAHASAGRRKLDGKGLAYTGAELTAVNTALAINDEQIKLATMQEIGVAIRVVDEAHRQKNFYASVMQGRGVATA